MSRPWRSADGQRSKPRLLREITCTKDGKTKTRARPQVAPENLQETRRRETKQAWARPAWISGVSSRGSRRHLCPPVNQSRYWAGVGFIGLIISGLVLLSGEFGATGFQFVSV